MSKHTPAPWIVKKWETETYKGCEIMNLEGVSVSYLSNLNWEANAKLIATAPELLEALQMLSEWNDKYPPNKVYSYDRAKVIETSLTEIVEKAKDAIKKATL